MESIYKEAMKRSSLQKTWVNYSNIALWDCPQEAYLHSSMFWYILKIEQNI